jgi:hypothetical protein
MSYVKRFVAVVLLVVVANTVVIGQEALKQIANDERGLIHGIVLDVDGLPLEGAIISALGADATLMAVTGTDGVYELEPLTPGSYLLRAHLSGFTVSGRNLVEVTPTNEILHRFVLQSQVSSSDVSIPPVLTAGLFEAEAEAQQGEDLEDPELDAESVQQVHDHGELAWRLRHLRRNVLREATQAAVASTTGSNSSGSMVAKFGRAVSSSARLASSLWSQIPLSGEVNFLTTGSFDSPADLFSTNAGPRGVAFMELNTPTSSNGEWSVQGAMTQGDVSSWILAGSYRSEVSTNHAMDIGMSYSTQRYEGGNPVALPALPADSRTVSAVHAFDSWTVSRSVSLDYGIGVANHDYVQGAALLSPKASVTLSPMKNIRMRATAMQSVRAQGAEEFLPPTGAGLWLPPERTFSSLSKDSRFQPQRLRHIEAVLERDFGSNYVIGVRAFRQAVNDQIVTLFGMSDIAGFKSDVGHYLVANGGNFDAGGWGVSVSRQLVNRIGGSVDYSFTRARWESSSESARIAARAPSAAKFGTESFHDITTVLNADVPETATQLFVVYRVNSAFANSGRVMTNRNLAARFDVKLKQGLPFLRFSNSDWEFLVAFRNMFREEIGVGAYDELLVFDPPKRIVGGLLVRF